MKLPESELAWKLADYRRANIEPPERILASPQATEGELMTSAEVADYLADSIGVLLVLLDDGSARFGAVRVAFEADLAYLLKVGKITPDEYNDITASEEMNL